ncbi:MAG: hypothetical protein AAGG51_16165 [Cyanobacteria bacterium P01_G01_bin.54]
MSRSTLNAWLPWIFTTTSLITTVGLGIAHYNLTQAQTDLTAHKTALELRISQLNQKVDTLERNQQAVKTSLQFSANCATTLKTMGDCGDRLRVH